MRSIIAMPFVWWCGRICFISMAGGVCSIFSGSWATPGEQGAAGGESIRLFFADQSGDAGEKRLSPWLRISFRATKNRRMRRSIAACRSLRRLEIARWRKASVCLRTCCGRRLLRHAKACLAGCFRRGRMCRPQLECRGLRSLFAARASRRATPSVGAGKPEFWPCKTISRSQRYCLDSVQSDPEYGFVQGLALPAIST